jgi:hypothetical protein
MPVEKSHERGACRESALRIFFAHATGVSPGHWLEREGRCDIEITPGGNP